MMSSMFSSPTDSRTRPGVTPAVNCCSGDSCEWVVDAGWMIRLRTSPILARWLNRLTPSTKARPASTPPRNSNDRTAPTPLGAYFFARSCHGLEGRPGVVHRCDVVLAVQPLGDRLRVFDVALDPQTECLDALDELPGAHRRQRGTEVPEQLHPRLDDVREAVADGAGVAGAVVRRVGHGESGEFLHVL